MVPPQAPNLLSTTESVTTRTRTRAATTTTATTSASALPPTHRNRNLRRRRHQHQHQQPRTSIISTNPPLLSSHDLFVVVENSTDTSPSSLPAAVSPRGRVSRVQSTAPSSSSAVARGQGQRSSNVVSQAPPPQPQPTHILSPWHNLHSTTSATTTDNTVRREHGRWSLRPNTNTETAGSAATAAACSPRKKPRFNSPPKPKPKARAKGAVQRASSSSASYGAVGEKKKIVGDRAAGPPQLTLDDTAEITTPSSTARRRGGTANTTTRLEHVASVDARGKSRGLRGRSSPLTYPPAEQYGDGVGGDGAGGGAIASSPAAVTDTHGLKQGSGTGTPQGKEGGAAGATSGGGQGSAEKRSLRSHGGASAYKSELAAYFPNYEEIVQLQPAKKEFLGVDTEISVLDDLPGPLNLDEHAMPQQPEFLNPLLNPVDTETITFPPSPHHPNPPPQTSQPHLHPDPLSDDLYFKSHRRLERQEKQLRNIERDRAQHEKIQLDRLLEELEGHDWLRTMGISGITDTEKKMYEPKRVYFVQEVAALIDKFRKWKEEEKRRRVEREMAVVDVDVDAEDGDEEGRESGEEEDGGGGVEGSGGEVEEEEEEDEKDGSREIDVDAMAAQQLHQETLSASSTPHNLKRPKISIRALEAKTRRLHTSSPSATAKAKPLPQQQQHAADGLEAMHNRNLQPATNSSRPSASSSLDMHHHHPQQQPNTPTQQTHPPDSKPFTSFYAQPHIRDIALGKTKASRRSRSRLAFGQPVPDLPEQREFELPRGMLTDEAINAAQRKLRRLRRGK